MCTRVPTYRFGPAGISLYVMTRDTLQALRNMEQKMQQFSCVLLLSVSTTPHFRPSVHCLGCFR